MLSLMINTLFVQTPRVTISLLVIVIPSSSPLTANSQPIPVTPTSRLVCERKRKQKWQVKLKGIWNQNSCWESGLINSWKCEMTYWFIRIKILNWHLKKFLLNYISAMETKALRKRVSKRINENRVRCVRVQIVCKMGISYAYTYYLCLRIYLFAIILLSLLIKPL